MRVMKTLVLALAILTLHHRASYGKSLACKNQEDAIAASMRHSLALERKLMQNQGHNHHHPIATAEQEFPNLPKVEKLSEKYMAIKGLLGDILQGHDWWVEMKNTKTYGEKDSRDPTRLHLDDRKRAFPQSFESLFSTSGLENEIQMKEFEKKKSEDSMVNTAEDLRRLNIFDIKKKRNKHTMYDEDRPPRPG